MSSKEEGKEEVVDSEEESSDDDAEDDFRTTTMLDQVRPSAPHYYLLVVCFQLVGPMSWGWRCVFTKADGNIGLPFSVRAAGQV